MIKPSFCLIQFSFHISDPDYEIDSINYFEKRPFQKHTPKTKIEPDESHEGGMRPDEVHHPCPEQGKTNAYQDFVEIDTNRGQPSPNILHATPTIIINSKLVLLSVASYFNRLFSKKQTRSNNNTPNLNPKIRFSLRMIPLGLPPQATRHEAQGVNGFQPARCSQVGVSRNNVWVLS